MFIYTSSCFGFILDCINNVKFPQVKEKEKTVYIRVFFSSFSTKDSHLEMFIQKKKFTTLAIFRHF